MLRPRTREALARTRAAGPHVVASSPFRPYLARIDLARLLAAPEMPLEDHRLLGELASGQRIEQGDESGLTQDQWLRRLNRFNQRQPGYGWPPAALIASVTALTASARRPCTITRTVSKTVS